MTKTDVRWQQRFANYQKALQQLRDAVSLAAERPLSQLENLGLIQAFEFTHELAWKTLKDFFVFQGNQEIYGSRDAIREAFNVGMVEHGEVWMDMIASRNKTSHTYNQAVAEEIVEAILQRYMPEFESLDELLLPYRIDLFLLGSIENAQLLEHIRRVGKSFYRADLAGGAGGRRHWLNMIMPKLRRADSATFVAWRGVTREISRFRQY